MVKHIGSKEEFDDELKAAGEKAVLVDFFAEWCGPCKMIAPEIEKLEQQYTNVIFLKVDVDQNEELTDEYGISAMPTFIIIKNTAKIEEFKGANKDKLKILVEKYNSS